MRLAPQLGLALAACLVAASASAQERPGVEVTFTGTVLMNGFYTSAKTNNVDLPQFAVPGDAAVDSFPTAGAGATMRQTRVQVNAFLAGFAGGNLSAELDVDFFGGQQPSAGGRTFPLLRIRRAWGELAWSRGAVFVGQEAPPIAELNPVSLAALGLSAYSGAGNLWLWIPQVRLSGDLVSTPGFVFTLEGSALAPTGYTPQGPFLTQPDRAEQSRRPYLQSRLRARWGAGPTAGEVSVGGHYGWLSTAGDSLLASKAAAVAARIPITAEVELRGEAFVGEGIAGLGGGAIGQNFGVGGVPVRTRGGWAQLNLHPARTVTLGGGFGIDDPEDEDLDLATQRLKNQTWEVHAHWRPAPIVLGLEFRQHRTTYGAGSATASHVNLAAGWTF